MLAVKASYDNGAVRWKNKPHIAGQHDLIVIFQDVDKVESSDKKPTDDSGEWQALSLSSLEKAYCDNEPEYSDAMLKTRNPEHHS